MKKFAIATMIALVASAASALEVGVTTARDYASTDALIALPRAPTIKIVSA